MTLQEQHLLREFKALLGQRVRLYSLTAFGSRARGDADSQSDMDALVVIDGPQDDRVRRVVSDCAWEASFASGIVLSPVVVGRNEWENGPDQDSLLALAVQREGVAV